MPSRPRATRSPHPGVVLLKPRDGHPTWRARCDDPDTGKRVFVRLDPNGAGRNAQARRAWAIERSRASARRRDQLASGAPPVTGTTLDAAVGRYFEDHPHLRPRTRDIYSRAARKLLDWAAREGVRSADGLNGPHIVAFRASLVKEPKRAERKRPKGRPRGTWGRGQKSASAERRKPAAVNIELRAVGTILGYLRRLGLLPFITLENLVDGLRKLPTPKEAPEFLRPPAIKALLKAALQHDSAMFKATREEHAARRKGGTPRYEPIAPFILVTLLTGMRLGEVEGLDWSEVDIEEGEIRLGTRTKTKHARTVSLEPSPALGDLFQALHDDEARGRVWTLTREQVRAAGRRLAKYDAPGGWTFQILRRTCGTYLTNAPGIFGAASAYRSARQLGHSVAIAERHYLGVVKVPKGGSTLEAAMGIEGMVGEILKAAKSR